MLADGRRFRLSPFRVFGSGQCCRLRDREIGPRCDPLLLSDGRPASGQSARVWRCGLFSYPHAPRMTWIRRSSTSWKVQHCSVIMHRRCSWLRRLLYPTDLPFRAASSNGIRRLSVDRYSVGDDGDTYRSGGSRTVVAAAWLGAALRIQCSLRQDLRGLHIVALLGAPMSPAGAEVTTNSRSLYEPVSSHVHGLPRWVGPQGARRFLTNADAVAQI